MNNMPETPHYERLYGIKPTSSVFHYTSLEKLKSFLESGTLWATHIAYFNDASEFFDAIDLANNHAIVRLKNSKENRDILYATEIMNLLGSFKKDRHKVYPYYVSCFSENGDSLDLWRAYCPQEAGYSFGFDWNINKDNRIIIGKCIYSEKDKKLLLAERYDYFYSTSIDKLLKKKSLIHDSFHSLIDDETEKRARLFIFDLLEYAIFFKNRAFKSENEYRVFIPRKPDDWSDVFFRCSDHLLVPYMKIPLYGKGELHLSEIYIGPTDHPRLSAISLRGFIESLNISKDNKFIINCASIIQSHIPIRSI